MEERCSLSAISCLYNEHFIMQEQEQTARLDHSCVAHKKVVAGLIAGKIQQFWAEVESLYRFELVKGRSIHTS